MWDFPSNRCGLFLQFTFYSQSAFAHFHTELTAIFRAFSDISSLF
nr:MAG TPA: hypothetical protein [Caudoviricetes sp.]